MDVFFQGLSIFENKKIKAEIFQKLIAGNKKIILKILKN